MLELTSTNVDMLISRCLVNEGEPIKSIIRSYIFDEDRIDEAKGEIVDLLSQLPEEFRSERGGGSSFLNMCNTREGVQWTGLHLMMENLVALGLAAGFVEFLLPRDKWSLMPGGMPYLVVKTEAMLAYAEFIRP